MIEVENLDFFYGQAQALHDINLQIPANQVTAFIGPSGCGKSTLLRCFNRMNDLVDVARIGSGADPHPWRRYSTTRTSTSSRSAGRSAWSFRSRIRFPKSIYENITYGLQIQGVNDRKKLDEVVEKSLRGAALWDEVKDRLHASGLGLSGGQQQRLCIARAIAVEPSIILMDEPCSALDPIATSKVEELIQQLKGKYTIVIVTHNMQQAGRCSDQTAFFYLGKLIEFAKTEKIFTNPAQKQTEDYITGRFG